MFARVAPEAGPDMCLLRTQLLAFDVGVEEHVSMRRSFAEVRLAVRVEGPIGADGTRPVLLEQEFDELMRSELAVKPTFASLLAGACLRSVMGQVVQAFDQANVGRSGI